MSPVDTSQHLLGLTAEVVNLLRGFFITASVVTMGVITALVRTKSRWLPVVRGLARDARESDPKLGNGSLRDDFNKALAELTKVVLSNQAMVSDVGGSLVRSVTALHERVDAVVLELKTHIKESASLEQSVKELVAEQETQRAKRGLGRVSSPEERQQYKDGTE